MKRDQTADTNGGPSKETNDGTGKSGRGKAEPARKRRQYLPARERRQRILESSREVFARSGLQGARTRELAQAAGINQATLFEHFDSKEALFAAAVLEPLVSLMQDALLRAQGYAAADSPAHLLDLLQNGMQQNLETVVEIYPLLVQGLFADRAIGEQLYREHLKPVLVTRSKAMRGFVRDSLDPDLVQLASFGMFFAIAMDRAMTGDHQNLTDTARQLAEFVTFGSASGAGPGN